MNRFLLVLLAAAAAARAEPQILLPEAPFGDGEREVVLFGFDDEAFPFQCRLQTHLVPGHPDSMAVPHGPPGSADEFIRFYGTIIRVDGQYRMWYYGNSGPETSDNGFGHGGHPGRALMYAVSDDAIHWTKPDLGLVAYQGSTHNNLVDLGEREPVVSDAVLYDPEDPDPSRRFKIVYEALRGAARANPCVAFSADGLRWKPYPHPIGAFLEMAGIMKFHGLYYVTGQSTGPAFPGGRSLMTLVSSDFEHWSPVGAMGMSRAAPDNHEEVHLGATVWNRGNVILGVYGQWHGTAEGDRRLVTMDLGFTISHDGLHYREPIPGFKFIAAREQRGSPAFDLPALMQGQGMENVGDRTFFWYSLWKGNGGTGVRLATWQRDRFGYLQTYAVPAASVPSDRYGAQAISRPFRISAGGARVFVNAGGLGKYTALKLQLMDASFRPIPGFTATVAAGGLRVPVEWQNHQAIGPELGECHLQIAFEGVRPEDARLYAAYVSLPSP